MAEIPVESVSETPPSRKRVLVRLLYTILFFVVLEIVKTILQLATFFQYIYLLITLKTSEPVRSFSNRVASYGYRVMRYLTLNENQRPFPFSDFGPELEAPEDPIRFD